MTRTAVIKALTTWADTYKQINTTYDALHKLTDCAPESELATALFRPFERYTETLSELIGDKTKFLDWFAYCNDFGNAALEVTINGNTFAVRNVQDLEKSIYLYKNQVPIYGEGKRRVMQ